MGKMPRTEVTYRGFIDGKEVSGFFKVIGRRSDVVSKRAKAVIRRKYHALPHALRLTYKTEENQKWEDKYASAARRRKRSY